MAVTAFDISNCILDRMYEVSPSVLEARLLNSGNILDAAVVGIPNKENGQVNHNYIIG